MRLLCSSAVWVGASILLATFNSSRAASTESWTHNPTARPSPDTDSRLPPPPSQDWQPLWTTVRRCLPSADAASLTQEDRLFNTELLDLLVSLLEEDICFWRRSNHG